MVINKALQLQVMDPVSNLNHHHPTPLHPHFNYSSVHEALKSHKYFLGTFNVMEKFNVSHRSRIAQEKIRARKASSTKRKRLK
jgi:hypothetical protein